MQEIIGFILISFSFITLFTLASGSLLLGIITYGVLIAFFAGITLLVI